jgi:hypothetical protein
MTKYANPDDDISNTHYGIFGRIGVIATVNVLRIVFWRSQNNLA